MTEIEARLKHAIKLLDAKQNDLRRYSEKYYQDCEDMREGIDEQQEKVGVLKSQLKLENEDVIPPGLPLCEDGNHLYENRTQRLRVTAGCLEITRHGGGFDNYMHKFELAKISSMKSSRNSDPMSVVAITPDGEYIRGIYNEAYDLVYCLRKSGIKNICNVMAVKSKDFMKLGTVYKVRRKKV